MFWFVFIFLWFHGVDRQKVDEFHEVGKCLFVFPPHRFFWIIYRNYEINKLRPSSLMENKMNNSLDWMDNKWQKI